MPDLYGGLADYIHMRAFELILAFDEVITRVGYRDTITSTRTNLLMGSHEEKMLTLTLSEVLNNFCYSYSRRKLIGSHEMGRRC